MHQILDRRFLDLPERGADTHLYTPRRRDPLLRRSWGASADTPVALYAGRLAEDEGLALALRAVRSMQELRPELRFVLVGDGPSRARLEEENPDLVFAGSRRGEDRARHLASGDLFLSPGPPGTSGEAIAEAMASALVLLAFDGGAADSRIESGLNGCTVPVGDEEAFVREGRDLIRREWSWPTLRWAARTAASGRSRNGMAGRLDRPLRETSGRSGF
jgi:glycosyltransferase involved in cell wall biosynthesis